MPKRTVEDRFWGKVEKRPGDGCWEWTAARDPKGYGRFAPVGTKTVLAHRFAWLLHHGETPQSSLLHQCDNPRCVRVDHMREGSLADNNREMWARGRGRTPLTGRTGERNYAAQLTESDVISIRTRFDEGESMASIARSFGCTYQNISRIVKRETWTHLT